MDFNEIKNMFTTNGIQFNEKELKDVFFKKENIKQSPSLSLDFFSFMKFLLSSEGEQEFRNFIRRTKHSMEIEKRKKYLLEKKETEGNNNFVEGKSNKKHKKARYL